MMRRDPPHPGLLPARVLRGARDLHCSHLALENREARVAHQQLHPGEGRRRAELRPRAALDPGGAERGEAVARLEALEPQVGGRGGVCLPAPHVRRRGLQLLRPVARARAQDLRDHGPPALHPIAGKGQDLVAVLGGVLQHLQRPQLVLPGHAAVDGDEAPEALRRLLVLHERPPDAAARVPRQLAQREEGDVSVAEVRLPPPRDGREVRPVVRRVHDRPRLGAPDDGPAHGAVRVVGRGDELDDAAAGRGGGVRGGAGGVRLLPLEQAAVEELRGELVPAVVGRGGPHRAPRRARRGVRQGVHCSRDQLGGPGAQHDLPPLRVEVADVGVELAYLLLQQALGAAGEAAPRDAERLAVPDVVRGADP
mmetsp:Transcript_3279/g.11408  ORF Transcript_3279/g.11408 Transcript_3279/m.11408 type:complete len:367 (+) Transcript_3279:97-1197(+)